MEATKKNPLDMLHGSIRDKLPKFALPVATTAILEQLFNASDVAIVGNFTDSESTAAVAAVGANSPIIGLIVNLLGANVVIAHAIGRGPKGNGRESAVLVSFLGGGLVALLGQWVAGPLLLFSKGHRSCRRAIFKAGYKRIKPSHTSEK